MNRWMAAAVAAGVATAGFAQTNAPAKAPKTWADSVTVKGDVRYRYESINDDAKGDFTRQRDRIRARLSAEAKVADNLKGGVGLSTGQSDPVSGNQTLGDGYNKKEFRLDTAYLDWALMSRDNAAASVVLGKMKNPFSTVCDRTVMDLVWDPDLTPEGATLQARMDGDVASFRANAGYMWVLERSGGNDDAKLYVGQGAVRMQFSPELYLTLGASYYDYEKVEGYEVFDWENKQSTFGNSSASVISGGKTNKLYDMDYNLVELFAEVGAFVGKTPLTLYGQTVQNTDAKKYDTGYLAGVTIGRAKNPKTYEIGYRYAELEKDAVLGAFTDSDRWGGGTDGHGHRVHARYQINKNLQAGVTYFVDEKKISDSAKTTDYDRLQADLVFAF